MHWINNKIFGEKYVKIYVIFIEKEKDININIMITNYKIKRFFKFLLLIHFILDMKFVSFKLKLQELCVTHSTGIRIRFQNF